MNRCLLLAAACMCLSASSAFTQKRTASMSKRPATAAPSPKAVCIGAQIPDGLVVVGIAKAPSCQQGAWELKKPDATEVVCDGSPMPDGYEVKEIIGVDKCAGANPLTNAMVIARTGMPYSSKAAVPFRATQRSPVQARNNDDSDEENAPTRHSARPSDSEENSGSIIRPSRPSREEIDVAIRRATVLTGMDYQDVTRAWGGGHTTDSLVEDGLRIEIWSYSRGRVYFRNGRVYMAMLLK